MRAEELRIGNLINYYSNGTAWGEVYTTFETFKTFEQIERHPDYEFKEFYKPIPLTEEWLLKFGFVVISEVGGYGLGLHLIYDSKNDFYDFIPFSTNDKDCYINIKHVHQLQNLYFSLTGEELTVKE